MILNLTKLQMINYIKKLRIAIKKENKMKNIDEVFGELEYEHIWYRNMKAIFLGYEVEITLMIDGDKDGEFEEGQYTAYKLFTKNSDSIYIDCVESILRYYKEERIELGYDEEFNENYPLIETVEDILKHITFSGILVRYAWEEDERRIGLTFECTWNEEDGVGVMLTNEKVDEVGYQDITM